MSKTTFTTEELANDNGGFDKALNRTLGFEGGFTVDHAGTTNLGVTQPTYDSWRKSKGLPTKSVKDIDPQETKQLYKEDFFDKPGFSKLTPDVAGVLFDFGVNAGTKRAAMSLQKAVGASPDGAIGPKTLKNFQDFISKNGEKKLLQKIIDERSRHNDNLIRKNPKKFGKYQEGWKNRINALKKEFDLISLNPFSVKEASADEIAPDHPASQEPKSSFTTEELFGDNPTDSPKESFTTEELFGKDYGKRYDGTNKGKGYFGELKMKDGKVATELSIGVEIDGKETEIPTLVPTLTEEEKNHLLSGGKPTQEIVNKAYLHAEQRIRENKSPFFDSPVQPKKDFSSPKIEDTSTIGQDINSIAGGLMRGMGQIPVGVSGIGQAIFDIAGDKSSAEHLRRWRQNQEKNVNFIFPTSKETTNFGKHPFKTGMRAVTESTPMMMMAFGSSAAAAIPQFQAISAASNLSRLEKAVKIAEAMKVISAREGLKGAALFAPQAFSDTYDAAREHDVSPNLAATLGITNAVGQTLLESKAFDFMLKGTGAGHIVYDIFMGGLVEGLMEEGTQGMLQNALTFAYDKPKDFEEGLKKLLEGVPEGIFAGAVMGSVASGAMAKSRTTIQKERDDMATREVARSIIEANAKKLKDPNMQAIGEVLVEKIADSAQNVSILTEDPEEKNVVPGDAPLDNIVRDKDGEPLEINTEKDKKKNPPKPKTPIERAAQYGEVVGKDAETGFPIIDTSIKPVAPVQTTTPEPTPKQTEALAPATGNVIPSDVLTPSTGDTYTRIEEPGVEIDFNKPQGLYTTPSKYISPHENLGGKKYTLTGNPKANVLKIEGGTDKSIAIRKDANSAGAGIWALRHIIGNDEFNILKNKSKSDLVSELQNQYPKTEWNRYFDKQEVLEALGAIKARENGYDAIYVTDKQMPEFDEYVGLNEKAFLKPEGAETANAGKPPVSSKGIYNAPQKNIDLRYLEELTAAYKGQKNLTITAIRDGKVVGTLEYSEFNKEPNIDYVNVPVEYQRQGIGGDLVKELQKSYPNKKIKWGMTTNEGTALKSFLDKELIKAHGITPETAGAGKGKPKADVKKYENTYTAEDKADIKTLSDIEINMPNGEVWTYTNPDSMDTIYDGNPSGHSKAMQEIGPKESFKLLEMAQEGKPLTKLQKEKVDALLADFRANIKPSLERLDNEIAKTTAELTQSEAEEVATAFENEEGLKKSDSQEASSITTPESAILKSEGDQGDEKANTISEQAGNLGRSAVSSDTTGTEGLPNGSGDGRAGGDTERNGATVNERDNGGIHDEVARKGSEGSRNYVITEKDEIGKGGQKSKYKDNITAIKLLKKITSENRPATTEEQQQLVKYVGWGGLKEAFDRYNEKWSKENAELKELLTPEEYDAARRSVLNAHYTERSIIKAIWTAVGNMGFYSGNVLEPSSGVGHFVGLAPQENKKFSLVELDKITGGIAKLLYPEANTQVLAFEDASIPQNYFGLAISNVPFSEHSPYDAKGQKLGIPKDLVLHDYFFAKALTALKPGGLMAFITSKGTLDKNNPAFRSWLNSRAKFLGAIRLPSDAFKENAGTEVVTDIIFLQKLMPGEKADNPDFVNTGSFEKDGKSATVNNYFLKNKKQILGKMEFTGSMYRDNELSVKSTGDFDKKLADAIEAFPKDIYSSQDKESNISDDIPDHSTVKESALIVKDGKVFQNNEGKIEEISVDPLEADRIEKMIAIRDAYRDLLHSERTSNLAKDDNVARLRIKLNTLYDSFVKSYGYLNEDKNSSLFEDDPDFPLLLSLEEVIPISSRKNEYKKRAIFTERQNQQHIRPTKADNLPSAIKISLSETGHLDFKYISELLSQPVSEVKKDLLKERYVYNDPDGDKLVIKDEYLSGNVKKKLENAREAAKINKEFERNVEDLKKVIPEDKPFDEITVTLGTPWVDPKTYQKFFKDMGIPLKIEYVKKLGVFHAKDTGYYAPNSGEYSVPGMKYHKLAEKALNGTSVKIMVTTRNSDGTESKTLDVEATELAKIRIELLKTQFKEWFWTDDSRRDAYVKWFNDNMNNTIDRQHDGSHQTFPGFVPTALSGPLRVPQINAIWRTIIEARTLLAHAVGAGKTAIMVISAMESKRLGIVKKNMFVVMKSTLVQFKSTINAMYPGANILIANPKNFGGKELKKFLAKAASGNWDIVVLTHENLEKIPNSPETIKSFIQEEIDELLAAIEDARIEDSRSFTVRRMETMLAALEAKLKEATDQAKKLDTLFFEELGVDSLYVDEAHEFKNLPYKTLLTTVKGLGNPAGVNKTRDLKMKTNAIRARNGKLVFATATPISNSIVEAYSMMKYLQPELLKEEGIDSFDAWRRTYADPVTEVEVDVSGGKYQIVERLRDFKNLDSLRRLAGKVWDIQTKKMLIKAGVFKRGPGGNLPLIKGTKDFEDIILPPSQELADYTRVLIERAKAIKRRGRAKEGEDILLVVLQDGIKAAIDMRMIDPTLPANPNSSKVEATIRILHEEYLKHNDVKGTQLVFIDKPAPDEKADWNPQVYIKKALVKLGIPAKEIAFVHEFSTDAEKETLYDNMNEGKIRILFGSTDKVGTGLNVQKRLVTGIHLGIPGEYKPSQIVQREGRVDRPGNMNKEIRLIRLIQKSSLDTFIYQLLEAKEAGIEAFLEGKNLGSLTEDAVNPYEVGKILSSGNPKVKEKAEVDRKIKAIGYAKNAYLKQRSTALKDVINLKKLSIEKEARAAGIKAFIDKLPSLEKPTKETFSIQIGNYKATDKKEALEAIYKTLEKVPINTPEPVPIGQYLGFPLYVNKIVVTDRVDISIGVKVGANPVQFLWGKVSQDPGGTFMSLDNAIFETPTALLSNLESSIQEISNNINSKNNLLQGKFTGAEELNDLLKRQTELEAALREDAEETVIEERPLKYRFRKTFHGDGTTTEEITENREKLDNDEGIDASTSSRSIDAFEPQGNANGTPAEFKLFEKVKALAKKWVEAPIGEKYVPRGLEGSRFRDNGTILVRSMNNLSVMIHEVTHDLFFKGSFKNDVMKVVGYSNNGKPIYAPDTKKARKELTEIYVKYYNGGKADHALEKRVTEGYSVLAQRMVEAPALTQREFPYLYAEVVSPGGKYYDPKFAELIADGQVIVREYQALSPLQKIGSRVLNTARAVDKGSFLNTAEKVIEQAVDRIYPLEKMAKEAGISGTVHDPSLWARANMTTRYVALENINTKNGYITIRNGEFKKIHDFNWKSLVDNLHKEGGDKNIEDFGYWLVARRVHFGYERLDGMSVADEGYEELQSILNNDNIDRKLATAAYQSEIKRFEDHGKMFDTLIRADLDLLHSKEVQLVDGKRYANLTAQEGYAPFQRDIFNEIIGDPNKESGVLRPMPGKNKVSSMMGRTGSDLPIVSPLYGAMMNHMEIMKKANRQIIYNIIGERISPAYPELFRSLPLIRVVDKDTGRMSYPQEKDHNIMMAYVGGKRMPFLVDKEIKALIDELFIFEELHLLEKALLRASNIFVKSTTALYIPFAISNFIVDQFTAVAQTKNNLVPILSQIKTVYKALSNMRGKEAQYFREYLMLGGDRQVYVNIAEMSPEKSFQALLKEKNALDHILGLIEGGAYILSIPSKYSEIWTRGTEYVLARQAGKGQLESLEEAGRVTAPFHHEGKAGGHVGRTYIKSMPYFKARMQVLAQMGRSLTSDKKSQKRALFTIIGLTFANIAAFAYLLNNASDDQKEEYNGIEAKELAGYIFFPHPSGSGFIRIRVPEQMTFLSTAINMMIADRLNNAKYKAKDYVDALTAPLPDQINITDPIRQFLSLWPQIMVPAAGASMNKRIYPSVRDIESRSMQAIPAKYRYYENTSKFAILLGSKLNISPLKIDFLVEGYLGRSIKGITGKEIPNPLIRKVYLESMRQVQNYYDMRETVDQDLKALRSGLRKEKYSGEEDYLTAIEVIIKNIDSDFEYYRSLKKIDPQDKDLQQLRRDILDGIDSLPSEIKTKR